MGQLHTKGVTIHVSGIPERRDKQKGIEAIFKAIMTDNVPKLMSDTQPKMQEAQRTSRRINVKNLHHGISH